MHYGPEEIEMDLTRPGSKKRGSLKLLTEIKYKCKNLLPFNKYK